MTESIKTAFANSFTVFTAFSAYRPARSLSPLSLALRLSRRETASKLKDHDFKVTWRTNGNLLGHPRSDLKHVGLMFHMPDSSYGEEYMELVREQEGNLARLRAFED